MTKKDHELTPDEAYELAMRDDDESASDVSPGDAQLTLNQGLSASLRGEAQVQLPESQSRAKFPPGTGSVDQSLLDSRRPKELKAVLMRLKGLSYDKIGDAIGVTDFTVRTWLRKPEVRPVYEQSRDSALEEAADVVRLHYDELMKTLTQIALEAPRDADRLAASKQIQSLLGRGGTKRVEVTGKVEHGVFHSIKQMVTGDAGNFLLEKPAEDPEREAEN